MGRKSEQAESHSEALFSSSHTRGMCATSTGESGEAQQSRPGCRHHIARDASRANCLWPHLDEQPSIGYTVENDGTQRQPVCTRPAKLRVMKGAGLMFAVAHIGRLPQP